MQDIKNTNKTPVFHTRQEFESGTSLAASGAHEVRYQTAKSCAFFWKGENSKREQDEKDE